MRYTDRTAGAKPGSGAVSPAAGGLDSRKMPGLSLFSELVKSCLAQPGLDNRATFRAISRHKRGGNP
ncbi:hypothetical protein LNP74_08245 [Klebsiella pneumoniae subsp. pneumoniae]|nr:hypothetical protein [Klebsiella pneumoniae subsp. pneumoniae]